MGRLALCVALVLSLALATSCGGGVAADETPKQATEARATQASVERQVDTPAAIAATSAASRPQPARQKAAAAASSTQTASQKRAAASLASSTNYDKYQLKASPSLHSGQAAGAGSLPAVASAAGGAADKATDKADKDKTDKADKAKAEGQGGPTGLLAHKKAAGQPQKAKASSSFALLKKFLPSFMTSAGAAAAVAAAAAADKPAGGQHSRSSAPATSSSALFAQLTGEGPLNYASGKLVGLLGAAKKRAPPAARDAPSLAAAIPNHAPFFLRKAAVDRQAAGGGALALASSLLSNPLKLGLLFSAPLLPSLLLTPLAIAGLSPAMSAINNLFGADDDDEPASGGQSASSRPLAALASGPNSPLASILQATGVSPLPSQASGAGGGSSSSNGAESSGGGGAQSSSGNLALQAFQSLLLGPTSTTERPLFNPGMFASSGIGNAMGSLASNSLGPASSSSASSSSSSSANSAQSRPFLSGGGGFLQTAASMISPSFAAPPSPTGGASGGGGDDDGPGIMQMASDVFEKVANYMGSGGGESGSGGGNKDIAQASGANAASSSPLTTLSALSSLSPFQLSSLFAPTAFGAALSGSGSSSSSGGSSSSGHSHAAGHTHRAGFLSTLRNVYELFSSSFLRRQEVGEANECQQRLVCELHQRAMNSKLFRRSLQSNLAELAQLDRNLIEQLKFGSQTLQARVDPDTKAMLSDFLKATNNFKSGRELVNCGQMFPKCSRAQLLVAANAHLSDPANGRSIGKFGQLMKKMKFKAAQQHQGQWKLRKPAAASKLAASQQQQQQQQASDYLQVAPMASSKQQQQQGGALAPVDSLKLAQQLMLLSQMSQPQAQLQQIQALAAGQFAAGAGQQYLAPATRSNPFAQQPQQQQQQAAAAVAAVGQPELSAGYMQASAFLPQYSPAPSQPARQTTYTDAVPPSQAYATEAPYFQQQQQQQPARQQQQQQQYLADPMAQYPQQQQQQQQQMQGMQQMQGIQGMQQQMQQPMQQQMQQQPQTLQYQSSYQNYAPSAPVAVEQPRQAAASQQPAGQAGGQDVAKAQTLGGGGGGKLAAAA